MNNSPINDLSLFELGPFIITIKEGIKIYYI